MILCLHVFYKSLPSHGHPQMVLSIGPTQSSIGVYKIRHRSTVVIPRYSSIFVILLRSFVTCLMIKWEGILMIVMMKV